MLRHFLVMAVVAFCLSAADHTKFTADKEFVAKQKNIYDLLWHTHQPSIVTPKLAQEGAAWNIEDNIDSYTNQLAVKEFLQRYHYGMLPRGEIFSIAYPELREEAIALFHLFYYAKDYTTFYKTALWARSHVNEGQFTYALTVAVIHRPDTKYIRLPSPYEVYPYFFFNSEVIQKAHTIKMQEQFDNKTVSGINTAVIPANYSGWYMQYGSQHENKLNYFIEDIGLNAYYYYFCHDFPFWMSSEEFGLNKGYRGEQYYHVHKELLARYYLERLSNDLGEIEDFDWNRRFPTGYYPTMNYHNGLPMPQRPHWSEMPTYKYKYVQEIENLESFITSAIDSGYILSTEGKLVDIYTPEGFDILGNIIEGNADSYNKKLYGSVDAVARHILGFSVEPATKYQVVPSALEHFGTSMRDPAFFRLYKRIVNFFMKYKNHLQVYSYDELVFPGVKIESVNVDPLVTYFDQFDAFINNAVMVSSKEDAESFSLKARQFRLNHKPFSYHITVNSEKNTKAIIRMFLGPKYDEHHKELDISENYMNFFELDQWIVDLIPGVNKIDRSSHESFSVVPDPDSIELSYDKAEEALEGKKAFVYSEQVYGFPDRLQLPKGKKEGMPFQLFVYVSHFDEAHSLKSDSPLWGKYVFDEKPMGFPLDRPMYSYNFTMPNMLFEDVKIFHKEEREINITV